MAGLDGIRNRIEPPEPVDKDLYELPPEEHSAIAQVPGSLPAVLDALEADHEYLLEGDVFTEDLIQNWVEWKRTNEVDPIRFRPHPHEFEMYFDICRHLASRRRSILLQGHARTRSPDGGPRQHCFGT